MLEIKDFDNQDVDGRSSLSSNLDWNDRLQLEKYCSKQKKIEKEEGFRPSQYFGAIDVEQLEDGIGDPKIDCKHINLTFKHFLRAFFRMLWN